MVEHEDQYSQILFDLCGDFFALGLQLSSGQVELPACQALKQRVLLMFEKMKADGHQANVLASEVEDAQYALAAYIDEMIQYTNWPGKAEWAQQPLQAVLFNESHAGVNFFHRLEEVRRRSGEATRVYYACLSLGFQGEYRMHGGDIEQLTEDLRRELFQGLPQAVSVNGKRPDDRVDTGRSLPLVPIATVLLILAIISITVLYFLVSSSGSETADLLDRMGRG
ncbi:MAG: DotU family type IV/VI secretion system protein [Deltaproteobacteria bacterium]|nr:DotU family type IV/VI secretion system protein [Deltaproteobacteria bacterium]